MAAENGDVIRRHISHVKSEERGVSGSKEGEGLPGEDLVDEVGSGNGVAKEVVASGSEYVKHRL